MNFLLDLSTTGFAFGISVQAAIINNGIKREAILIKLKDNQIFCSRTDITYLLPMKKLLFCLLLPFAIQAQTLPDSTTRKIDSIFRFYTSSTPGCAVAVTLN